MCFSNKSAKSVNIIRLILFLYVIITIPVYCSLYDNLVQIDIVYPDGSTDFGFGFVFSESADSVLIISASDLLFSFLDELYLELSVSFTNGYYTDECSIPYFDSKFKFMLFWVIKPPDFKWDNRYTSTDVSNGDLVLLAGRYGDLRNRSQASHGEIASSADRYMTIVSSSQESGKIGAPVINDGKIAGLVVNDQGTQISAVSIKFIQEIVYEWLSIAPEKQVPRLPYATIGMNVNLNLPLSKIGNIMAAPGIGAFLETGLSRIFAVRLGYSQNKFQSGELRTFDDIFKFRNEFNAFSLAFQYVESTTYEDKSFSRVFIEYSYIRHNPQLNSGGTWRDLKDYDRFNNSYQSITHGFALGANINILLDQHLFLGGEIGVQYTLTSYLHLNPLEPFAEPGGNDWLILLKVYLGYMIGNKEPQNRFLADEY